MPSKMLENQKLDQITHDIIGAAIEVHLRLDCGYRMDLVVEDEIIVEIKAIEKLLPIHDAQLLSYLRLTRKTVGLLLNFHVPVLKDGLKRIVNEFPDSASRR